MTTSSKRIVELETRFWQSMVDQDADTAIDLLSEPALMVSAHGAMKFDHAGYRKMADQGTMVVKSFEFDDMEVMFPNDDTAVLTYHVKQGISPRGKNETITQSMHDSSTWIRQDGGEWKCVMHTETPVDAKATKPTKH